MSAQEMDKALDDIGFDAEVPKETPKEVPAEEPKAEDPPKEKETKNKPPGFKTYDEWVADGRDPADFRGEKAYKAQYETLKEVRELKGAMSGVVNSMDVWKGQQNVIMAKKIEDDRADAAEQLEKAKDDMDIDAALAATEKINKIDNQRAQPAAPVARTVNPVIAEFAQKNPLINIDSGQYNEELHKDMVMIYHGILDNFIGGDRSRSGEITNSQIFRAQAKAFNDAQKLHPETIQKPRTSRQTPVTSQKRPAGKKGDSRARLKEFPVSSKNPRDNNAAQELYDIIKKTNPEQAEIFAKNMLED